MFMELRWSYRITITLLVIIIILTLRALVRIIRYMLVCRDIKFSFLYCDFILYHIHTQNLSIDYLENFLFL